jgi:myo-inositol-1(or 4)-monophosphatase
MERSEMQDLTNFLDTAVAIAREAGDLLREGWGNANQISYKGEVDLVTEYDTRAEALIIAALRRAFPDHTLQAEEQGTLNTATGDKNPYLWLIDPLDGTTNFAHGFPVFAVSLALLHQNPERSLPGRPLIGVIYDPTRDECFAAARGQGAALNGQVIHPSDTPTLDTALLATGFAYDRRTRADNNTGHFINFIRRCQGVRRAGAAALDMAYVACGRLDGFWELRLHPWDVAAGVLLVQEAGGRISDFTGGSDYSSGDQIVASNGHIHDKMLEVLRLGDFVETRRR